MNIKTNLWVDLQSLMTTFRDVKVNMDKVAANTVKHIGQDIIEHARNTDKFHMGTEFKEGITFKQLNQYSGIVSSEVYNSQGVEYSNFLEYGNDPGTGIITPINAKALHFKVGGQDVFVKSVSPISAEKLGFMSDAISETTSNIDTIFTEEFGKIKQGQ